jgi:hypothetical protein
MAATVWKNRIVDTGMVDPMTLVPNPKNYRRHPNAQVAALNGVLDEVGWVAPLTVNRTTGNLVDGHARAELAVRKGVNKVPVQYVDLSEDDEAKVLATLDPIGSLATIDRASLQALLDEVQTADEGLLLMLENLRPPDIDAYEPDYDPAIGNGSVTDKDIDDAAGRLDGRYAHQEEVHMEHVCPHCGKTFYTS